MSVHQSSCALGALIALGLFSPAMADSYKASSNTAMSITGDIEMDDFSITFQNGESLAFSTLLADHFMVDGADRPASVYKVETPGDPELENGNALCGAGKVSYVATWGDEDGATTVAVFTGGKPPASSDQMCASYSYDIE